MNSFGKQERIYTIIAILSVAFFATWTYSMGVFSQVWNYSSWGFFQPRNLLAYALLWAAWMVWKGKV